MKRIRIVGLCLVAVFALAAVAAASASAAEPAYYECKKEAAGHGEYAKGCNVKKAKGGFERVEGIGKKHTFAGKGGAATLHTPAVGGEIKCTAFKDSGTLTSPTTEGKVLSIFTGCSTLGKKCTSTGAPAGEIKTNDLSGGLGYINKAEKKVGVDLKAETGTELASFSCEGLAVVVTGSVIGEQTGDINKFSKASKAVFEVTAEGFQKYKNLEGGEADVLESTIGGAGPFESGQQATAANTGETLLVKA